MKDEKTVLSISLTEQQYTELEKMACLLGSSKASIVRLALHKFLSHQNNSIEKKEEENVQRARL